MLSQPKEIGSISSTVTQQKILAKLSRSYICPHCRIKHLDLLSICDNTNMDNILDNQTKYNIPDSKDMLLFTYKNIKSNNNSKQLKSILNNNNNRHNNQIKSIKNNKSSYNIKRLRQIIVYVLSIIAFYIFTNMSNSI